MEMRGEEWSMEERGVLRFDFEGEADGLFHPKVILEWKCACATNAGREGDE